MEFLLAVSLTSSKDPIRKAELFFSMYDIDRNGLIDGNEMRSVIEVCFFLIFLS
jgi:Ca2+-binding EF-hand superfamily protein